MSTLKSTDYNTILKFYNIPLDAKNIKTRQSLAENLLATKLCRCIKTITSKNKTNKRKSNKYTNKTISICHNSVIKQKGYTIRKFTCKKTT